METIGFGQEDLLETDDGKHIDGFVVLVVRGQVAEQELFWTKRRVRQSVPSRVPCLRPAMVRFLFWRRFKCFGMAIEHA